MASTRHDGKEIPMQDTQIVVEEFAATDDCPLNLREEPWSFALDQRAFGPRRLIVAFADRSGRLVRMACTDRTDPPELALGRCLDFSAQGAAAAVAYCDEALAWGPQPDEVVDRFELARSIAASYGVHLIDWIACDDQLFRSSRIAAKALGNGGSATDPDEWWDLP
jgi:hypothetical protein